MTFLRICLISPFIEKHRLGTVVGTAVGTVVGTVAGTVVAVPNQCFSTKQEQSYYVARGELSSAVEGCHRGPAYHLSPPCPPISMLGHRASRVLRRSLLEHAPSLEFKRLWLSLPGNFVV